MQLRTEKAGCERKRKTYAPVSAWMEADPYIGLGAQQGYYRDPETGFQLCTYRTYDPVEGRWLTPDPIGLSGGLNLYGYVGGNPVGNSDPSGLVRVKLISYRIFGPGWHRGVVVEDNMKSGRRAYSFAGGPENYGYYGFGRVTSRSGPWWNRDTQDFRLYHRRDSGDQRVFTLVDDCSAYDSWVSRFSALTVGFMSRNRKPYALLPSDTYDEFGDPDGSANSNTWARKLLEGAGLLGAYERAASKPGGGMPWAPGWDIDSPWYP